MAASAALVAALVVWVRSSKTVQEQPSALEPVIEEPAAAAEAETPMVIVEEVEDVVVEAEAPEPDVETRPVTTTIAPRMPEPPPAAEADAEPTPGSVPLRSDDKLATVNGVAITGGDLVLFGSSFADQAQHLSPDAYDHFLNHAIDRELIRQSAESAGVALTDEQREKLDQIADEVAARANAPWMGNLKDTGTIEERVAFERREVEAHMLLANLLAQRGISVPNPELTDEQVESIYKERASDFGALLSLIHI
jgi:hypothetical protein